MQLVYNTQAGWTSIQLTKFLHFMGALLVWLLFSMSLSLGEKAVVLWFLFSLHLRSFFFSSFSPNPPIRGDLRGLCSFVLFLLSFFF